jgi:hypothetical protein
MSERVYHAMQRANAAQNALVDAQDRKRATWLGQLLACWGRLGTGSCKPEEALREAFMAGYEARGGDAYISTPEHRESLFAQWLEHTQEGR